MSISVTSPSSLLSMSNGQIAVGNEGNATAATMSGDGSIAKTGVLTVTGASGDFKGVGKFGVHNVAPVSQTPDTGLANASVSITLLTEVAAAINAQATHVNDIRKCLREHGLMA